MSQLKYFQISDILDLSDKTDLDKLGNSVPQIGKGNKYIRDNSMYFSERRF